MGHVLIVAILGYFCAAELGACDERIVNDFLCGLFHDLPEVLTRDIISPVKTSVEGLDDLIKDIEKRQVAKNCCRCCRGAGMRKLFTLRRTSLPTA